MLVLVGTLAVVIGFCMIAAGVYEKEESKEEPLKDIEPIE